MAQGSRQSQRDGGSTWASRSYIGPLIYCYSAIYQIFTFLCSHPVTIKNKKTDEIILIRLFLSRQFKMYSHHKF
jgi:hypothetical protein